LIGFDRALLRDRIEDLAHLVRTRPRLADHRHLGLGNLHHFRACGDEREQRLHEDTAGAARRGRHVEDREFPGFVVLGYLLHGVLRVVVKGRGQSSRYAATPRDRTLRYHSSSVSSCHICLAWSSRPACSSSIRRRSAPARITPEPTSSPCTSASLMSSCRSLRTHALRGTLKEAFGR